MSERFQDLPAPLNIISEEEYNILDSDILYSSEIKRIFKKYSTDFKTYHKFILSLPLYKYYYNDISSNAVFKTSEWSYCFEIIMGFFDLDDIDKKANKYMLLRKKEDDIDEHVFNYFCGENTPLICRKTKDIIYTYFDL